MARRRIRQPRSRQYEAAPINYKMGGSRRTRGGSYRKVYLQGQLEQVQNYMNMASTELGNDYNLEIHRLGWLQDEMARLDDMIAGWHDTEASAAGTRDENWRKDQDLRHRRNQLQQKIDTERTDNKITARQAAVSDAQIPDSTKQAIGRIATSDYSATNMSELGAKLINDFPNLASLPQKLQRQQAAVAINDAMLAKFAGQELVGEETQAIRRADALNTASALTGVPQAEISAALYSSARSAHIANFEREYSYAGSLVPMEGMSPEQKDAAVAAAAERQKNASDILKKWMARRDKLAAEFEGGMPAAPSYEDVRARAGEMYQPITAREAREGYAEQVDRDRLMRETVSEMPKDQRILMQAARRGQRFVDGDTDAVFGPGHEERGESGLSESELMAAGFIKQQLQAGTLSMNDLIPYATRIAEAEGLDDSEKVVSSRDRILADAMGALMGDYRNTLPAADVSRSPDVPKLEQPPQQQALDPRRNQSALDALGDIDFNDFPEGL